MPRSLAQAHRCDQALANPAISWQAVNALIFADRSPRCSATHAINRTMVIAFPSETELDLPNQSAGVNRPAWVNRLIVRIVRTVSVIVRIIAVGIVPIVWIRIVKERVPEIVKEKSPVEVAMAESISAKATAVKAAAKTATIEATATKAASSTEAAATTTATAARHHV